MKRLKAWKEFTLIILLLIFFGAIHGYLLWYMQKSFWISLFLSLLITSPLTFLFVCFFIHANKEIIMNVKKLIAGQLNKWPKDFGADELRRQMREIFHLLTEQKNQMAEIIKEKKYLEAVLDGIEEGVLVTNARGRILKINEALRQLFSIPADTRAQMPLEIIRHLILEEAIKKTTQDGQKRSFEFTPPLAQRTFRVNVVGFYPSLEGKPEEKEQIKGAITIFHDISRLKELERMRQDFVANVSHELRTPLTTIKGYIETLIDGAIKEEVAEQFVLVIKKHADRLIKIVEDLLTLSRIESREFQLKIEKIHLSQFIDGILDFIQEAAEKKKISFSTQGVLPSIWVAADRNYLELVFINLLDNAIKYTPEGGSIAITARIEHEKYAQITIQDTGIGIPKEDLPRIFERFYRVEKGRSKEYEGTGLGLSIVKHIVQAHNGRVWAESKLGKGSTFYFTLPLKSLNTPLNNCL